MNVVAVLKRTIGLDRRRARASLELEAGRFARRLSGFLPSRLHVNTLIGASGKTVVARSRYLVRNNGYAMGAVECFASNLVGCGITPSWTLPDELTSLKQKIQDAWLRWSTECDAEGVADFYGLQRRVARELFIAGENFARLRPRRQNNKLSVPLQIQLLPSEQLPTERNLFLSNGNKVRQGIEFDPLGRRQNYHFWRVHPGDVTMSWAFGQITIIPAAQILHVHDPIESGQIRGLPRLTPAIVPLWCLDGYDDAELERKKTAALFSVFIKREEPETTFIDKVAEDQAKADDGKALVSLEPGTAHQLLPGEDVSVAAPADVGPNYEAFQYRQLTRFCAAIGLPYSSVTGDMVRANYGNQRAALLEARRRLEALQSGIIVHQFCRPMARAFLDYAVLSGVLDLPGYADDPSPYLNITWLAPRWDWIDPLKDIQAEVIAVNAGFKARSQTIRETGGDPVQNDKEIAEDHAREKELGIDLSGSRSPAKEIAADPVEGLTVEPKPLSAELTERRRPPQWPLN